jgi:3-deoxy-D-manno-octulosonate 8-phosphate phosphatase (KDO 8-P phosphatase)
LNISFLRQGQSNKLVAFEELLQLASVDAGEVAFIGDDLNDIQLMQRSEFAVAVADAAEETRAVAHYITQARGGSGAVREVIEIILKAQGRWSGILKHFRQ